MPSFPELKESEIIYVCDKLKEALSMTATELYNFNKKLKS
tara:strand:+ start:117 stop:236 length:120 start_codon:yes stop_codon:yes gene_type:complete